MIAKLIARGADRDEAIARMRRALGEYIIGGVASTIPFHQTVLAHPVFVEGHAATDWIERDNVGRDLAPAELAPAAEDEAAPQPRDYTLEVNGKRFAVRLFAEPGTEVAAMPNGAQPAAKRPRAALKGGKKGASDGALVSPIQGTVLRVAVESGATVKAGDLICVVEAMKMENEITAPRDGTVQDLAVATGDTIKIGAKIATIV